MSDVEPVQPPNDDDDEGRLTSPEAPAEEGDEQGAG